MSALKDKLGDEAHAELMALLNPASPSWKQWLIGTARSWTNWFGAFLIAAPELLPQLLPQAEQLLTPDHYMRLVQWIGIVVIVLRFKTTQSVSQKGAP